MHIPISLPHDRQDFTNKKFSLFFQFFIPDLITLINNFYIEKKMAKKDAARDADKKLMEDKRLKERIISFVKTQVKENDQIVSNEEVAVYLKR